MPKPLTRNGKKLRKGKRMRKGAGYRIATPTDKRFAATLLKTFNFGGKRLAIFSVPKRSI